MNIKLSVLIAFGYLLLSMTSAAQVKLKSAKVSFYTTSDDKDWNTKVKVSLHLSDGTLVGTADYNSCDSFSQPADIAKCFCCVAPGQVNGNTRFEDASTKGPFETVLSNPVDRQKIKTGYIKIYISPTGNDRWVFKPTLTLDFTSGPAFTITNHLSTIVAQDAPETVIVFADHNNQ